MKIAVIGAGAAGCFAAANISDHEHHEITIFEKTAKSLQKVKVSGGGRCNVTHHCFEVPALLEKYPRGKQLLKKTLYSFAPSQTINWFENRGVRIKAEHDGRMFPVTDSSQSIIDALMDELKRKNVSINYHKSVQRIQKIKEEFIIEFADGTSYTADKVLISCGGFPKPENYSWIKELGHSIEEPVPSLFTFNVPGNPITELMGVVVENASVKIAGTKMMEEGPVLITHWGFSGPCVLRTSAWGARDLADKKYEFTILINWLDNLSENDWKEEIKKIRQNLGAQLVIHKNPFGLPKRLWEFMMWKNQVSDQIKWGELSSSHQNKLMESLLRDRYEVKGKTTFKEEFVTCGGVTLSEVDPSTMESRIIKGLFFAGEILNVDGITGGFNFQHAWASGFVAAMGLGVVK